MRWTDSIKLLRDCSDDLCSSGLGQERQLFQRVIKRPRVLGSFDLDTNKDGLLWFLSRGDSAFLGYASLRLVDGLVVVGYLDWHMKPSAMLDMMDIEARCI